MIEATEADIGRRVIYDARPIIPGTMRGTITALDGRGVKVQFDHDDQGAGPLRVFSNLKWAAA